MAVKWTGIGNVTGRMARARSGMKAGTVALAASHAARGQSRAQETDLYQDQTGNLRGGTFGESEATATGARITLGVQADYGPHVVFGTSRMAARDFLTPAAEETAREASEDLVRLAQRFGG